ncbi:glutamine synthetase beta-grasp domain-containing protein [candidate division CSSED10-310 bacterium]|uniref:Glutamine synthetase beta-grasp domain-containing protein n=1 Tax=candidate division CSSED10-310 bacterium TaxID=2855610 RepID=A0ABV6YWL8_UNCC1
MASHYALTNPISLILDKSREDFSREDMMKVIQDKQIERITFHYTALDGKLKELKLPVANPKQAERILTDGERVDGSSLFKHMVDASLSDLYAIPVYKTAFLNPFDQGSLDFICRFIMNDGTLAPFALDTILQKACKVFERRHHLELYALGELEFFLLSKPSVSLYPAPKQRGYHASAPFIKTGQIVNEMVNNITQITGSVKYAHSEVGYVEKVRSDAEEIKGKEAEQLEIEFLPTPIEEAADHLVLSRWLIRNIAYKYGCVATFTPKLEEGVAGNGFHIHLALRKDDENVMVEEAGNLSVQARKLIGGLCKYAESLTAFGNTVSSAYLRLVPNQEAPTRICWSHLNRSAMIRVPLGWSKINGLAQILNPQKMGKTHAPGSRQTVELRSPDGSAIVHLLLAGLTMAAEWGMSQEESLEIATKLEVKGNIFENQALLQKLPALPKSCVESARLLLRNRDLYERDDIFPAGVINYTAKLLRAENDEAINEYLADLPADDRLHETRKIMHKDLHRH